MLFIYHILVFAIVPVVAGIATGVFINGYKISDFGVLFAGAALMITAVFALLLFQVAIAGTGEVAEVGVRPTVTVFQHSRNLLLSEWYQWLPEFLVGIGFALFIKNLRL